MLTFLDLVSAVEQVSHPIQTMEHSLHSVDPFEILDMCPISDDLLPSDEVFLESLIQSDLLMDVGSVVPNFKHPICKWITTNIPSVQYLLSTQESLVFQG